MIGGFLQLLALVVFAASVWAVIDAAARPAAAYVAAGKLTKPAWLGILVAALLLPAFTGVLGLFGLVAIVAVIVYFVDVRPAVREVGGGGASGPYGPWR